MKRIAKVLTITALLVSLSACRLFLGPDPENSPRGIFDSIWNDFDASYALFDVKGIDWKSVYHNYAEEISPGMGGRELFRVCSGMLEELNDAHVNLSSPFGLFNSGRRLDLMNMEPFSLELVKTGYLEDGYSTAGEGMFTYGTFKTKPSAGYIYISGFAKGENMGGSQDWIQAVNGVVKSLSETDSLVLDIRGNRGGLVANVEYISRRFAAEKKDYAQVRTKNGPDRNDFSSPVVFAIKPEGTVYAKPIVLLTNAQTISAGEWFTLALRSQDHVTQAGSVTCGAFSLSLERFLVNGWTYTVSVQKVTDMGGTCYEGSGLSPGAEHLVKNTGANIEAGIDDQLEYALSLLP
ncbi:MAG: S41 family peptidase [Treponema sp.]|nr:S41 family peptidase [Treponema sp.]